MPLAWLLVLLLIVGVVLALFPCDPTIKRVILAIILILVLVALLQAFGILRGGPRLVT